MMSCPSSRLLSPNRLGLRTVLVAALFSLSALPACSKAPEPAAAPAETAKAAEGPVVVVTTNKGAFEVQLFADKAPASVKNFLDYVDAGHYDGTIFHRVIKDFMIQGGGFTPDGQQKSTKPPVKNEADNGLKNTRGTVAMARTAVVDSATSQFFVNHADNAFLDFKNDSPQGYGYCVFGEVTSGMDVVDAIATTEKGPKQPGVFQDRPKDDIVIESIKRKG